MTVSHQDRSFHQDLPTFGAPIKPSMHRVKDGRIQMTSLNVVTVAVVVMIVLMADRGPVSSATSLHSLVHAVDGKKPTSGGGRGGGGGGGAGASAASNSGTSKKEVRVRRGEPSAPPDLYYTSESANASRLIESLMKGYDKHQRPNYKGGPVHVGITMYLSSVGAISEVNEDFTLDFYFRQFWKDERLAFNADEDELYMTNEMLDRFWWPDTFFTNAKRANFHAVTTKNGFLRIKPSGQISLSLRLTVIAMCTMDLTLFPMDIQVCSLEIESYGLSQKHISYYWAEGEKTSVKRDEKQKQPEFTIEGINLISKVEGTSTGNYSSLACQFYLVRSLGYYILQIYIPSTLIVVLSWVSFWLHRNAVSVRFALGITAILTLTVLIFSTNASVPKVSYHKSIDVYLVTCLFMVFAALLEYAAVSYIVNKTPAPINTERVNMSFQTEAAAGRHQQRPPTQQEMEMRSCVPVDNKPKPCPAPPQTECSNIIDRFSRVLFPVVFFVFSVTYWIVYMKLSYTEMAKRLH